MSSFAWLFAATWKGSLLIAVVFSIFGITARRIPAKWRHALLLVALIRMVMPIAPESSFSIFNVARREPQPIFALAPGPARVIEAREIAPFPAPLEAERRERVEAIVLVIWAIGAALVVLRLAGKTIRLRRRLKLNPPQPLTHTGAADLLDACRDVVGIRRRVFLASTDAVASPSLLGVFRPTLLLPGVIAETMTPDQLRFIFLHELAHLRRFDVVVNWFVTVVQAVHWFNPLVWIAISRLEEERELACDALALEHLDRDERSAYGETVIQLLDRMQRPRMIPGLVAMTSTKHQLKRRIQMIASFRNQRGAIWSAALVAVFALVTLTDAQAGEKRMIRLEGPLSAEAKATMERLDQSVTSELRNVSVEDLLFDVTRATGVVFKVAEGAIDDRIRGARIDMTAKNIPAHFVVMEALASFDLALDFEDGPTVVKIRDNGQMLARRLPAPGPGAITKDVIFIRKSDEPGEEEEVNLKTKALVDVVEENGVTHRRVTFERDGKAEGTLEIAVRR